MADKPLAKQHGKPTTASERMDAARAARQEGMLREVCLASILSRVWPSYVTEPAVKNPDFPFLMVIQTPAGRLVYRVHTEETDLVAHLERKPSPETIPTMAEKLAVLLHLATEGFK